MAGLARRGVDTVPFDRMGKVRQRPDPDRPRCWLEGREMGSGRAVLTPYELVGVDHRPRAGWDRTAFAMTSAGTAAHLDRLKAVASALLEAVEHDALAQAMAAPVAWWALPEVGPDPSGPCAALAGRVGVGRTTLYRALARETERGVPVQAGCQ